MRELVQKGGNPVEAKRRGREGAQRETFEALAERYLNEHARRHKRSANEDERNLKLHILPRWRRRWIEDITRADMVELAEGLIADGKQTLANRVQGLVSSIFSFGLDVAVVKHNPIAGMRRRGIETVGTRVLSDDEIALFWGAIVLPPVSRNLGLALRLALLSGCRVGEIAGLARTELEHVNEQGRARWLIPAARSKNGRAHLVPLSELARQTILEVDNEGSPYVFPSPRSPQLPAHGHALTVAMSRFAQIASSEAWRANPPTPHDLRRTVATRLSELGIGREDRDAVLNHARRDVGGRHYDRYDREREKRRALELWAAEINSILHGRKRSATVVSFRGPT
jgi:integrase